MSNNNYYYRKYLKYKIKYLKLKGGNTCEEPETYTHCDQYCSDQLSYYKCNNIVKMNIEKMNIVIQSMNIGLPASVNIYNIEEVSDLIFNEDLKKSHFIYFLQEVKKEENQNELEDIIKEKYTYIDFIKNDQYSKGNNGIWKLDKSNSYNVIIYNNIFWSIIKNYTIDDANLNNDIKFSNGKILELSEDNIKNFFSRTSGILELKNKINLKRYLCISIHGKPIIPICKELRKISKRFQNTSNDRYKLKSSIKILNLTSNIFQVINKLIIFSNKYNYKLIIAGDWNIIIDNINDIKKKCNKIIKSNGIYSAEDTLLLEESEYYMIYDKLNIELTKFQEHIDLKKIYIFKDSKKGYDNIITNYTNENDYELVTIDNVHHDNDHDRIELKKKII